MFLDLVPFCEQARAYEWKGTVTLNILPPSVGEKISGFGYPSSSAEILHGEPSQIRFVLFIHTQPLASLRRFLKSVVTEHFSRFPGSFSN